MRRYAPSYGATPAKAITTFSQSSRRSRGIETPARADLARIDRNRKKKGSNDDWTLVWQRLR